MKRDTFLIMLCVTGIISLILAVIFCITGFESNVRLYTVIGLALMLISVLITFVDSLKNLNK